MEVRKELLPNPLDTETNLAKYIKTFLPVRTGGLNIRLLEDSSHEYERLEAMSVFYPIPVQSAALGHCRSEKVEK